MTECRYCHTLIEEDLEKCPKCHGPLGVCDCGALLDYKSKHGLCAKCFENLPEITMENAPELYVLVTQAMEEFENGEYEEWD